MASAKEKREQILNYIIERIESDGYPPSVREICQYTGIKSTSTVHMHIKALEQMGLIKKVPGKKRVLSVEGVNDTPTVRVPVIGTVAAGVPIMTIENFEGYIPFLSGSSYRGDLFALKVKGSSMIEAGILDGDLVIAESVKTAENGEIVVAMIDDEATVKRFYKENGHFRLQPENSTMQPIYADEVSILGRVVAEYRIYK